MYGQQIVKYALVRKQDLPIHSIPVLCLDICRHHQYYIFGQGKMSEDQGKIKKLYLVYL